MVANVDYRSWQYTTQKIVPSKKYIIFLVFLTAAIIISGSYNKPVFENSFKVFGFSSPTPGKPLYAPIKSDICNPMFNEGSFLREQKYCFNPNDLNNVNKNYSCMRKWQPDGCCVHFYSRSETLNCVKSISNEKKYLIFIGDSRIRYIHNAIKTFLGIKTSMIKYQHDDFVFNEETNTNITFYFKKYMNSSLVEEIRKTKEIALKHPTTIIIGLACHMMYKYNDNPPLGLQEFEHHLKEAKMILHDIGSIAHVIWLFQASHSDSYQIIERSLENKINHHKLMKENKFLKKILKEGYYQPITEDFFNYMIDENKKRKIYSYMDEYNRIADKILNGTSVKLWHSAKYIADKSQEHYIDSMHVPDYANYNYFQMILNMICNKHMKLEDNFCCT